jgi:hypothetical protein
MRNISSTVMSSRRATNVGREPPLDAIAADEPQSDPVLRSDFASSAVLP